MGSDRTVRLTPLADADMEGIWNFSADQWSIDQADAYSRELFAAFDELATGRRRGRPAEIRPNYMKFSVGSHVVFFRHLQSGIEVIRILHQSMDIRRHL